METEKAPIVSIPPPTPIDHSIERLRLIRDIVYLLLLVAAAVTFALTGHETLAGTAFGTAAAYVVPTPARLPRQGLAVGLAILGGCLGAMVQA